MGTAQGETMKTEMTKTVFEEPTRMLLDAASMNNRAFAYRFDYVPMVFRHNGMGAFHSAEMDYVFGNLTAAVAGSEEEAGKVSQRMMDAWLAFIRSGDPGWKAYTAQAPQAFCFEAEPEA